MQFHHGLFIVLEGADGSGKGTQFRLLKERLTAVGYDVAVFDFPRYDQPSSYFVRQYLNGAYGSAVEMSPYSSSLLYALDRFEAAADIRKALKEGRIVLSNRYVGSNMAHQGSKFSDPVEQRGFFIWEDNLEFEMLGVPRPTLNIFLRVPAETSYELIKRKAARSYTDRTHDELEADIEHLKRSVATYDTLCRLFPKDFKAIDCTKNGELLAIPTINNLIWQEIKPLLPTEPPHPGRSTVVRLDELSDPEKPAPAATESSASPAVVSAAKLPKDSRQLSLEASGISLLTAGLIRTLQGISVKASTPWQTKREYYVPKSLKPAEAKNYRQKMDQLTERHKRLHRSLINVLGAKRLKDAREKLDTTGLSAQAAGILTAAVPLAALVNLELSGSPADIYNLLTRLAGSGYPEAETIAGKLLKNCRENYAKEFENAGITLPPAGTKLANERGKAASQVAELLPQTLPDVSQPIKLTAASPRNELELVSDIIFPYSQLSREEIDQEVSDWTYEQKAEALTAAVKDGSPALNAASYHWDILNGWNELTQILGTTELNRLQLQSPSPRFGFSTPESIDEAGLDEDFAGCFDLSLELYSKLQAAGPENIAAYAVLYGHKFRWEATTSLPQLAALAIELNDLPLVQDMKERAAGAHPLLWSTLDQPPPKSAPPKAATAPSKQSSSKPRSSSRRRGGKPKKS